MADVTELRLAFTVPDFDQALAFYRDALGLPQLADWSTGAGRVVALDVGRAVLELLDEAQAAVVDEAEAGATLVAPPVTTPWGDRNARLEAPDGMQLTLFTPGEPLP